MGFGMNYNAEPISVEEPVELAPQSPSRNQVDIEIRGDQIEERQVQPEEIRLEVPAVLLRPEEDHADINASPSPLRPSQL